MSTNAVGLLHNTAIAPLCGKSEIEFLKKHLLCSVLQSSAVNAVRSATNTDVNVDI